MSRAPFKRRWHPGLGDTRSRERDQIKQSEQRAWLVAQRIESHGADGLNDWLNSAGINTWGMTDASEALAIIRKRLGEAVWRRALDVVVLM